MTEDAPMSLPELERAPGSLPPVIWRDDVYWRQIAPDFGTFLSLFDLSSESSLDG
jgi:hypothetical protein